MLNTEFVCSCKFVLSMICQYLFFRGFQEFIKNSFDRNQFKKKKPLKYLHEFRLIVAGEWPASDVI